MDFKTFVNKYEDPLPNVGIIRSTNDPERQREYIKQGERKRDFHCFNTQLVRRCSSYKRYTQHLYHIKYGKIYISKLLNQDIAFVVFEFDSYKENAENTEDISMYSPSYHYIKPKHGFKWYIMISNVVNILPPSCQNIIDYLKNSAHCDDLNCINFNIIHRENLNVRNFIEIIHRKNLNRRNLVDVNVDCRRLIDIFNVWLDEIENMYYYEQTGQIFTEDLRNDLFEKLYDLYINLRL